MFVCLFVFYEYLRKAKRSAFFHSRTIARQRIFFAAKHKWTTLCISRPLFDGSQLFAGHEMGFRLMKRKNKLHGMIIKIINMNKSTKLRTNAFIHAYLLVCYLSQSSSVRHGFPFDVQSLTKNRTRVHCFCIKRIFPNLACVFDFRKFKSTRDVVNQCISYVP